MEPHHGRPPPDKATGHQSLVVQCGRNLFRDAGPGIADAAPELMAYAALRRLPPGLMLDVGAAAGLRTRIMLENQPASRAIAFEPFPGNWPHFENVIGGQSTMFAATEQPAMPLNDRVTLVRKAICDHAHGARFHVRATVPPDAQGVWSHFPGYSSLGRLLGTRPADHDGLTTITVPTTTIDAVLDGREALFMKIDVQGGEPAVLRGARSSLLAGRIKILLIEYRGQPDLLDLLDGYQVYDQPYSLWPRPGITPDHLTQWNILASVPLSTGATALTGWPITIDRGNLPAFFQSMRSQVSNMETDLLCVHPSVTDAYLATAEIT